jgi:cellulose synthase/poly-beta-1,6-N-acetylglucosamine synthase-like glycosyltransferase
MLFWTSAGAIVATYFAYPAVLWAAVLVRGPRPQPRAPSAQPPVVTLVVVAYNEAAVIGQRLHNLAALDYPAGRLNILVLSDGSSDGTEAGHRPTPA